MLFPIVMDFECDGMCPVNSRPKIKKDVFDYIFLEKDNEIVQFEVVAPPFIGSFVTEFIEKNSSYDFKICSEKDINKLNLAAEWFPYIGEFKLKGNIKKQRII